MTLSRSLRLFALVPFLGFAANAAAQGVLPGADTLPAASNPTAPGTAGNYSSSTVEGGADRLFDVKSDSVDLESGSMVWKGKTFNLGDTRIIRARFERYLNSPAPSDDLDAYIALLAAIEARISSINFNDSETNRNRSIQEAWNLLFEASKSPYDNGASLTLANQVMKAWRERNELRNFNITIEQQKAMLRQQEEKLKDRADAVADRQAGNRTLTTRDRQGRTTTTAAAGQVMGQRELALLEEERAEMRAETKGSGASQALIGAKSKLEFQSTIITFLSQRRFRHTLLANAFYRQLYKASHQQIEVGDKQLKEFFPVSNFVPSLETLDSMAREAINDVGVGLRTFESMDANKERFAAYERLQETFVLGEFEPDILRLDPAKKRAYVEIARDLRDLQKFADDRDLESAEETLGRISALATDFPAARYRSKIRTAKNASDMAIIAAKQAALANGKDRDEKVAAHLATATKIWPLNPGVRGFLNEMSGHMDLVAKRMPEFDKLHESKNYREIFNRKEEFAVALIQDKHRMEKLNEALAHIGKVEALAAQAEALTTGGNRYLAWDSVMEAARIDPEDTRVAALRSRLAPGVADYAKLLADGSRFEAERRLGAALTAYLAAEDLNRGSPVCREAVDRVALSLVRDTTL